MSNPITKFKSERIELSNHLNPKCKYNNINNKEDIEAIWINNSDLDELLHIKPSNILEKDYFLEIKHTISIYYNDSIPLNNSDTTKALNKASGAIKRCIGHVEKIDSDTRLKLFENYREAMKVFFDESVTSSNFNFTIQQLYAIEFALENSKNHKPAYKQSPKSDSIFQHLVYLWSDVFNGKVDSNDGDFKDFTIIMTRLLRIPYVEPQKKIQLAKKEEENFKRLIGS